MSTSTTTSSRHHRKQRFPRLDRRKLFHDVYRSPSPSDLEEDPLSVDGDFVDDEVDAGFYSKRPRLATQVAPPSSRPSTVRAMRQPASVSSTRRQQQQDTTACRLDKRARDEHNEQERSRRRELAVIYELIRCSFSEDDLRYLGQCSGPKSVEKLSYPQVLQIAYQLLLEEQHNLVMFEKSLQAIKLVEKEYLHVGLPIPQRPFCPAIPESHRKVVQVVDSLLKLDKSARTPDGVYEVTPAERAAIGDHQLYAVFPHPATVDQDDHLPAAGAGRPAFQTTSTHSGHLKSHVSRPGNLLITNGTGSAITHVNSTTAAVRRLVSAGSGSSNCSSRAAGHRNPSAGAQGEPFKPSASHSDSSSGAGSPRACSAGFIDSSSMKEGSTRELMVFDWLGLKQEPMNRSGAKPDEEIDKAMSEWSEGSCRASAQPRRRTRPTIACVFSSAGAPGAARRLIRTQNVGRRSTTNPNNGCGSRWGLRQPFRSISHQDEQVEQANEAVNDGVATNNLMVVPTKSRSLVRRSAYSNL